MSKHHKAIRAISVFQEIQFELCSISVLILPEECHTAILLIAPNTKYNMAFFQTYLLTVLIVFSSLSVSGWRIYYSLHDLLQMYGLPKEIFPTNVRNYSLDENNVLEVNLETPCLTKFDSTVYFESTVQAHLSKGKLWGIQGLSNKELFVWLPVKGIIVNYPEAGLAVIDITLANKTLSLSVFERPLICEPEGMCIYKSHLSITFCYINYLKSESYIL